MIYPIVDCFLCARQASQQGLLQLLLIFFSIKEEEDLRTYLLVHILLYTFYKKQKIRFCKNSFLPVINRTALIGHDYIPRS